MVPRAVLMKSGLVSLNTARQVNTAHPKITMNSARPMTNLSKSAHSTVKWPIHKNTAFKNSNFNQRVNIVKDKNVNTTRPKVVVIVVQGNNVNAGNPHLDLQDKGVIDSGCSRHMTGNMSYLTDYEEIDGRYVAFGGNPKGGKITRKCTIKTGNLDFENVYFVRELKFNLFSVSQMCDKKNSVLFNETECIVLSSNFKLIDESQVLLRVPRKNNMYSVDLKNIVPKGGLTCLFVKATSDESKLWHRRLGHLNFKTINKLVKGNLVRFTSNFLKMMKTVLLVKRESIQEPPDPSWIEAMQEELLQFKLQEVWTLVDLPNGKRAIGTKWAFKNKKNERGIVIRNKARLVAQGFTEVKTASTPMETQKPLLKDKDGEEVLDRKSTTGGCQFLGSRLISWQCKKQTVVANSITEAEYVAASSCCGQVLWIQNQLLDYGYNFMHTKIFIDNNKKAKKSVRLMMEKLVIRENRQRVLVRKRIERIGENKNRKRAVWNKNRQSDLVSKRIERSVNAARHKLNTVDKS
ncbi:ribonuclease H-like domain-containing protein [Tanacetum coccineum]